MHEKKKNAFPINSTVENNITGLDDEIRYLLSYAKKKKKKEQVISHASLKACLTGRVP